MIIVWGLYHEQQNTLKCGELPNEFILAFCCHFGYFLALSATFWQSWLIFILHCGVLQIVECVTAEAFMKFFKLFYVLKICSYVFMLCNIEIPNIVVILIQQSFRHYPFISKNGNIIILKYADLNWFFGLTYQKQNPFNPFLNMQTFCRLVFLKTCFFADLLLHLLNMQTFFADLPFLFLQTCCCNFWICRLFLLTFCRLFFMIFG